MKRQLLPILALLAVALSAGTQTPAATIQCNPVVPGANTWPNGTYSQTCGTTTYGQNMNNVLQNLVAGDNANYADAGDRFIGRYATPGDTLTILFFNSALAGGEQDISYTIVSGDTLETAADRLSNSITANASLQTIGVSAYAQGSSVYINSTASNTTYAQTTNSGSTESINLTVTGTNSETATIQGGALGNAIGNFYLFNAPSDFNKAVRQLVITPAHKLSDDDSPDGVLVVEGTTFNEYSVIFEQAINGQANTTIESTAAHEAGHWADRLYSKNGVLGVQYTLIGGTVTPGDTITVTVNNTALSGGALQVPYTVQGGDTLASIAQNLVSAINANTTLKHLGVDATAIIKEGKLPEFQITASAPTPTTYSISANAGATESVGPLDYTGGASDSKLFIHATAADWKAINKFSLCSGYIYGTAFPYSYQGGLLSGKQDPNGNYFCNDNTDGIDPYPHYPGDGETLISTFNNITPAMTPEQIIRAVYNNIFDAEKPKVERHEIFAEEFTQLTSPDWTYEEGPNAGQPNLSSSEWLYNSGYFSCTKAIVASLVSQGTLPSADPLCPKH
ncbi:MAG TPA: hypothetical protein V6C86_10005 [Oculatellaceae cyanobacterium]